MSGQILNGMTIVDMSTLLAAPLASSLLSDFGARVIKIEHPVGGDPLRAFPPYRDGVPLQNKVVNRNKESVAIDLHAAEGQALVKRIVARADALVTNFRLETLQGWGLDYPDLLPHAPSLVMLHITGFGRTGRYKNRPGFARVAESFSGLTHMTGFPDRSPLFAGYPIADAVGGIYGAFGLAMGLLHRQRTGEGQLVEFGLFEPLLKVMENLVIGYDQAGVVPEREGTHNREVAPNDVYRCQDDRWIVVPASTQRMFERLATAIGRPELRTDERFVDNVARVRHRGLLDEELHGYFASHDAREVVELLTRAGVAAGQINSIADLVTDEHIRERELLVRVADAELGTAPLVQDALPRMSATPGAIRSLGESIGRSTASVLTEFGCSTEEIERLAASGTIRIDGSER